MTNLERTLRSKLAKLGRSSKAIAASLKKLKCKEYSGKEYRNYNESCPIATYLHKVVKDYRFNVTYGRITVIDSNNNDVCSFTPSTDVLKFVRNFDADKFPELKKKV